MKLYNGTGHSQKEYEKEFLELGFEVEHEPRVQRVAANQLEAEGRRVAASIPADAHVLVGGAQLLVEAMCLDLLGKGCRLYAAQTERETGPDGGFVFNLAGVSETPLSKWWRKK